MVFKIINRHRMVLYNKHRWMFWSPSRMHDSQCSLHHIQANCDGKSRLSASTIETPTWHRLSLMDSLD